MKFLSNSNYYSQVKEIFTNNENIDIAVAFWGEDAIKLFKDIPDKEIRVICNIESGACNPKVLKELLETSNVTLKTNKRLHAKVLLQPSQVIIGSANISANGLSFEGSEQTGWIETGVHTENEDLLIQTKKWYDKIWKKSSEITPEIIKTAEANWKKRRTNRPLDSSNESLLDAAFKDIGKFLDRNIYFAIYRNAKLSDEATTTFEQLATEYSSYDIAKKIDCYEDWSELPDNAYLIDLYYGPQKGFEYCGIKFCPNEPVIGKFKYDDDSEGEIKIVFKKKVIFDYKITKTDQKLIKKGISKLWNYQSDDEGATIIPFVEGIKILKKII